MTPAAEICCENEIRLPAATTKQCMEMHGTRPGTGIRDPIIGFPC